MRGHTGDRPVWNWHPRKVTSQWLNRGKRSPAYGDLLVNVLNLNGAGKKVSQEIASKEARAHLDVQPDSILPVRPEGLSW